jgi:hypothetical protein
MRLCKDCKWAINLDPKGDARSLSVNWDCEHPSSMFPVRPNLVTGESEKPIYASCSMARSSDKTIDGRGEGCGPSGRFWEPIEPEFSGIVGFGETLTPQ